jgi:hypothetical protein
MCDVLYRFSTLCGTRHLNGCSTSVGCFALHYRQGFSLNHCWFIRHDVVSLFSSFHPFLLTFSTPLKHSLIQVVDPVKRGLYTGWFTKFYPGLWYIFLGLFPAKFPYKVVVDFQYLRSNTGFSKRSIVNAVLCPPAWVTVPSSQLGQQIRQTSWNVARG